MAKMTNQNVIKAFYNQNTGNKVESHTGNLYITTDGKRLMNYGTCLAQRVGNTIIINSSKYSVTTSKIQTWLRGEFAYHPSVVYTGKPVPFNISDLKEYVNMKLNEEVQI